MISHGANNPDLRHQWGEISKELSEGMARPIPLGKKRVMLGDFGGVIECAMQHVSTHHNHQLSQGGGRMVPQDAGHRLFVKLQSGKEHLKIITSKPEGLCRINHLPDVRIREEKHRALRLSFSSRDAMNRRQRTVAAWGKFFHRRDELLESRLLLQRAFVFALHDVVFALPEIRAGPCLVFLVAENRTNRFPHPGREFAMGEDFRKWIAGRIGEMHRDLFSEFLALLDCEFGQFRERFKLRGLLGEPLSFSADCRLTPARASGDFGVAETGGEKLYFLSTPGFFVRIHW